MSYRNFLFKILTAFYYSLGWLLTIIPPLILYYLCVIISKYFNISLPQIIIIVFGVLQLFIFLKCLKNEFEKQRKKDEEEINEARKQFEKEIREKRQSLELQEMAQLVKIKEEEKRVENLKQSTVRILESATPFKDCAKMIVDLMTVEFDESIRLLKKKSRPALRAADEIKLLKKKASLALLEAKTLAYKLDYLCSIFPEITDYLSDEQDLISLNRYSDYTELEEQRDRTKDFLTPQEYNSMSETERNQLALDRYLQRTKTPGQVGRDYEMACAFKLRSLGYEVEEFGIKNGVHDLGRDLIAMRRLANGICQCLIIQCKCWKKERPVRENVIFQLYGTYISYLIENKLDSIDNNEDIKVYPVLMIPSFSTLSEVAKEACKRLNIIIKTQDHIDYPRIKCNINRGQKIYHLPFDQLYNQTEIKNKGEFYAYTVKEAESKGFRRARKHFFDS